MLLALDWRSDRAHSTGAGLALCTVAPAPAGNVCRETSATSTQHGFSAKDTNAQAMSDFEKHMIIALCITTVVMLLNILAASSGVTDGLADDTHGEIGELIRRLMH